MSSYFFSCFSHLGDSCTKYYCSTSLKLAQVKFFLNIYLLGGICTYAVSTVFYIVVLSKLNLSVSYPVVVLTVVATTFFEVVLKEEVPTIHWLGIGLMLSGISAIAFGKTS